MEIYTRREFHSENKTIENALIKNAWKISATTTMHKFKGKRHQQTLTS